MVQQQLSIETMCPVKAHFQDMFAENLRNKPLKYYFPQDLKYIINDEALLALFDLTEQTKVIQQRQADPLYLLGTITPGWGWDNGPHLGRQLRREVGYVWWKGVNGG